MAYSKIVLTFTGDGSSNINIGENVNFRITNLDIATDIDTTEVCSSIRDAPYKFLWDDSVPNVSAVTPNYVTAFELDYNSKGQYTVSRVGNIVTIEATKNNMEFSLFSATAGVTAVITNEAVIPLFQIDSVLFSEDVGNPNDNVSVDVTTNITITDVTSPVTITGNPDNTVSFDFARETTFLLSVNNGTTFIDRYVTTPDYLPTPSVSILLTPSGANITIDANTTTLDVTYSLDNVTYKASNIFTGIASGDYIAYTKDSYGSVRQKTFTVNEFSEPTTPTDPIIFLSNTNSFRFKKDVVWNNINIFKNNQNTLSCEEATKLAYKYTQKFVTTDAITTQFKTNYSGISIKTTDQYGAEVVITPDKKTTNIGNKEKRDAIKYDLGDGTNGVYFKVGNIYDYDTEVVTDTYDLAGDVPDWAEIGKYFSIDLVYYKIIDILYVKDVNAKVLVVDSLFASFGTDIIGVIYNTFDYEVYEFTINTGDYINKPFNIAISFTDDTFSTVNLLSELIDVYDDLSHMIEVKATNDENNEIFYATNIIHKLHLDYSLFGLAGENEIEIHKADSSVYQISSSKYPKKELELMYLSTMMAEKVSQIFSLKSITINGLKYTTESIDTPQRLGVSNLYSVKVKLFEIGISDDSNRDQFLASSGDFSSTEELDSTFLVD